MKALSGLAAPDRSRIIRRLSSLLNDGNNSPSLSLGQRSCLHDLYCVADAAFVLLVMSLQCIGLLDDFSDYGVFYMVFNRNNDCLVHLVADDLADTDFSKISFHGLSPFPDPELRFCLGRDRGLNSCDILANLSDLSRIL